MNSLYPVGSIYIGTQSECPLATLIPNSSWSLVAQDRSIQGSSSNHAANTTIEAGLPNITGKSNITDSHGLIATISNTTGVFSAEGNNSHPSMVNTTISNGAALVFNAPKSSSIYGNSSTVQPPAYVVNIWRRST